MSETYDVTRPSVAVPLIGDPLPRYESRAKVTGTSPYAADVALAGALHAVLVTTPMAKGRVTSVDAGAAQAVPGVRLILTHENVEAHADVVPYTRGGAGQSSLQPLASVHFHMLFLDGVYVERADGTLRFRRSGAPTNSELDALTRTLARRVGRLLERRGLVERDAEGAWLAGDDDAEPAPIDELRAASVTYRVAIGPRRGQKAFTLQTLPPAPDEPLGTAGGFSLHAGVATGANERAKLERLCRPVSAVR